MKYKEEPFGYDPEEYVAFERDEHGRILTTYCDECEGSGEGYVEGTTCKKCKGRGEVSL